MRVQDDIERDFEKPMAVCEGSAVWVRFETRRLPVAVNYILPIPDAVVAPSRQALQGTRTGATNPCIQQFAVPEIIIKCPTKKYRSI